ncbi:pentatricopeptide repeat-containing protein At1g08070, chloroplastic-like [Zingiber officinale]|nr:pentatricopeptide repeat-containing protein At1g08070, chloroplastic-like [Zingiber officinale]
MFKGYNAAGLRRGALALFRRMRRRGVLHNRFTFPLVIKSCSGASVEGEQVHCLAIKSGVEACGFVVPALIEMYSSDGAIGSARKVFDAMPERNVVTWTAIISAYLSVSNVQSARELFDQTVERDVILWNTIVSGYARCGDMATAMELFALIPDPDIIAWNTILLGFANVGNLTACECLFGEMPERNVFSWNGLLGGYAHHAQYYKVLDVFNQMLCSSDVKANDATLVTVLSACARLGALEMGRWIHSYAKSIGLNANVYVGNGLIDMYAKCGCIDDAVEVYNAMPRRDLITWNSMIGGLAMHGRGVEALQLFNKMKSISERPDGITFVGVLSACVHMGLVEDGLMFFRMMTEDYKIVPWIEHCGCMVDLLSRAGLLTEALGFIRKMPMEPDCVIWNSLLRACQIHKNVVLAELVLNQLTRLVPDDVANYIVLSNIYGASGRWKDAARMKQIAKQKSAEKTPGCSLIEVNSQVVEFFSTDARHPQTWKIYKVLEELTNVLKLPAVEVELIELCMFDS